jgi:hypothetical protein
MIPALERNPLGEGSSWSQESCIRLSISWESGERKKD